MNYRGERLEDSSLQVVLKANKYKDANFMIQLALNIMVCKGEINVE